MRFLYSALLYLLLPGLLLRLLWRSRRAPDYRRRILERFGHFPAAGGHMPVIWVHAVSVGEALAAAPLVEILLEDYPDCRLVVTTTTPTGSAQVKARFGDRVLHVYAPWDLPGSIKRFLRRVRPRLLLLMETELWPNTVHYCHAAGCRVVVANARMSERSARRYARFPGLTGSMLGKINRVACQSGADGQRFLSLGLRPAALQITGSIKFDVSPSAEMRIQSLQLREEYGTDSRPVLVAASTHPGEDEQVLAAFARVREVIENCLLLLVPRHPERFSDVAELCEGAGWRVRRRSSATPPGPDVDIVLGDTMGELALLQSVGSIVLVGGSLVPHGGHNPLEAAAWGIPVVCGPHMFNFLEITGMLVDAGAMLQVDQDELADELSGLLRDPDRCLRMGAAGQGVVKNNAGALERLQILVAEELAPG
jgi:3-deoxy-D-manno-octulosonic-acid transferase